MSITGNKIKTIVFAIVGMLVIQGSILNVSAAPNEENTQLARKDSRSYSGCMASIKSSRYRRLGMWGLYNDRVI